MTTTLRKIPFLACTVWLAVFLGCALGVRICLGTPGSESARPAPQDLAQPLPSDPADRLLIQEWRMSQLRTQQIEASFPGTISGVSLGELGRVAFILRQANDLPRKLLDEDDRQLIFSAVEGQPPEEIEANLPAIVAYVRLSMSVSLYLAQASKRRPLFGPREGMETLREINRRIHDFRERELDDARSGRIDPARVLTRANLGPLGNPAMLAKVERAYEAGESQRRRQSALAGCAAVPLLVLASLVVSWLLSRRATHRYSSLTFPYRQVVA